MDSRLREQLLGYLLGALDHDEVEAVELLLSQRPDLHEELDQLRDLLDPLDDIPSEERPPASLVERTCNLVEFHAAREGEPGFGIESTSGPSHGEPPAIVTSDNPAVQSEWTFADMFVAVGVCLSLSLLFLPALAASRDQARTMQCSNQLQTLGLALHSYFDTFGSLPAIPTTGDHSFSGIYASRLRECQLLEDDSLVVCPSSPLADSLDAWQGVFTVDGQRDGQPRRSADGSQPNLAAVRQSGGSYAYCMGVIIDGEYHTPQFEGRSTFAVLGDGSWANDSTHLGHGKQGQNLLFEDGQVRWVKSGGFSSLLDHPYENLHGQHAAGLSWTDSVLGDTATPPLGNIPTLGKPR